MIWLNRIFLLLVLNSVSGTISYVILKILSSILEKCGAIESVYSLMKIAAAFFFCPFLAMVVFYQHKLQPLRISNPGFDVTIYKLTVAWLIAGTGAAALHLYRRNKAKSEMVSAVPIREKEIWKLAGQADTDLQRKKGTNMHIQIKILYRPTSPYASGIFKPCVYISEDYLHLEKEKLRIVLCHELLHIKKRDLLFRKLCSILEIVFCWNPIVYMLSEDITEWGEWDCDRLVFQNEMNGDAKGYYELLFELMGLQIGDSNGVNPLASYMHKQDSVKLRLLRTRKYLNRGSNHIRPPRLIVKLSMVGVCICIHLLSAMGYYTFQKHQYPQTISPYAYKYQMSHVNYQGSLKDFVSISIDNLFSDEKLIYTEAANQWENTISWLLDENEVRATPTYYVSGEYIQVALVVEGGIVWVGIMDENGICSYVEGNGAISMNFQIEEAGFYKIFVRNVSGDTVQIYGGYY